MTLLEALRNARTLFIEGKHQFAGMLMTVDLLIEAAGDDRSLAADMLEALDAVTPHPLMFSVFVDGAEWTAGDERVAPVYRHNRKPEEIAAVFGNAILKATRAA